MIIQSSFKPPYWLKNPHLQTLYPFFLNFAPSLKFSWERIELKDGDFLDLAWYGLEQNKPIVLVLHGLESSVEGWYIKRLFKKIKKLGYQAVCMHFRGCGQAPNRLKRSYHAGETQDLKEVITYLKTKYPQLPIIAIGFSMGGNILLKYLGEEKEQSFIHQAIAVSVPFLLDNAASRLNQGFSKIYQWFILRQLYKKILQKNISSQVKQYNTFWFFDDIFTASLHGFKNVNDYYQSCSSRQFLKTITTPTLIIHAKDDPFLTAQAIPYLEELSDAITLELTEHGGHIGFIAEEKGKLSYWLEDRIIEYLKK